MEMAYLDYKGVLYQKNKSTFDYLYFFFPKVIFIINENLDDLVWKLSFPELLLTLFKCFFMATPNTIRETVLWLELEI